ncbi:MULTISPECIES: hypothetical protein [Serratia]|jgi:hypothetical protein|uniref:Uncharacterized protein n=1 Tax=Serratia quinivorans TaxID=137545 RepID=A0A379YBJ3_9GAMM|nr:MULTISPECIES: hypothetical protein [Serratia]RYM59048.1 hypothetical protein BSR03_20540 [Serratia proteamaculans]CAI1700027.1 Uncharacterised protein [Serratia quinivorans]SUI43182.1 Uncharacterised protein [Serratia quinivorans]
MLTLIGFVLLVSPCGHDACDALPVSERVYPSYDQCERLKEAIQLRRPHAVLYCDAAYRPEK